MTKWNGLHTLPARLSQATELSFLQIDISPGFKYKGNPNACWHEEQIEQHFTGYTAHWGSIISMCQKSAAIGSSYQHNCVRVLMKISNTNQQQQHISTLSLFSKAQPVILQTSGRAAQESHYKYKNQRRPTFLVNLINTYKLHCTD